MQKLLEIFKNININDAIKIEESDFQYIALKNLYLNIKNKDFYLSLILANSIVCYQLSSTWEKYWEEFAKKSGDFFASLKLKEESKKEMIENIFYFFKEFLPNSKWNKRFVETKIKRLERLLPFLENFLKSEKKYYENMTLFQEELAKIMNQKKEDKTIVFAVKMFSYWARNYFEKLVYFPENINIPIDSRLTKIYEIYNEDENLKIKDFYKILSQKLNIPELHLDAIIWVNSDKLIK